MQFCLTTFLYVLGDYILEYEYRYEQVLIIPKR